MSKSKKIIITIALCIIIVLCIIYLIYFFFGESKEIKSTELTEEQKIEILNRLNFGSGTNSVPDTEKIKILKKINPEISKSGSLSEEQKLNILNSLNKK